VTKLDPAASAPLYSTYLGGSVNDRGVGIAVDSVGSAYVTGETQSTNFPTTAGTLDPMFNGFVDAFVTKLNPAGSAPLYSTYLGGTGDDRGLGIAVDIVGNAYVTGRTSSVNFPTTAGAFDTTYNGGSSDAFVVKISDIAPPATLTLDPAADTNPVGTSHCVTATVHDAFANPTPGVVVRFTVTGAINTTGSATTDANGEADFCYVGPSSPGVDAITAFADTDNDAMSDVGEPNGAAGKTWTPGAPAALLLAPPADTNPVATVHCVTAMVQDAFGNPTPGVIVRFSVTGAVIASGSATTDAGGQATFCYGGPATPGVDAITAFADSNGNSAQDLGEPAGGAMKTWVPGPPATLTLTPPAASNTVDTQHCVTATVRDAFGSPTPGVVVRFTVTGSVSDSGSATTNASGQATFCYQGPPLPGADAIGAYADTDMTRRRIPASRLAPPQRRGCCQRRRRSARSSSSKAARSLRRMATGRPSTGTLGRRGQETLREQNGTAIMVPRSRSMCVRSTCRRSSATGRGRRPASMARPRSTARGRSSTASK
jgi:hypothetical protein